MSMKKIYIIIASLMAFMSISCSLDETAYQADESFIVDAETAEGVLLGVYKKLGSDGIYRLNLPFIYNLPTDEGTVGSNELSVRKSEACNAFAATSPYVEETWESLYSGIFDANSFIEVMVEKMPSFSEKDQTICSYYVAEAKALRALFYFELVRWFGHVPLILTTKDSYKQPHEFKQEKPALVYEQIVNDLNEAADVLPYYNEDDVRDDNAFRLSKGGVLGILTKVYATWAGYPLRDVSKWESAANTAKKLIESGKHGLLSDFDQLWHNSGSNKWDPRESLLEISYWSPLATTSSSGRVGVVNGVGSQSGGLRNGNHYYQNLYKLQPTLLTSWKDYDKDERFAISYCDTYYYKAGADYTADGVSFLKSWLEGDRESRSRKQYAYRLVPGKWNTEVYVPDANYQVSNTYTNINWYVLRYSDVLLLYAEALNEANQGPTAEAFEAVNMVRRRAFGQNCDVASSESDLDPSLGYLDFQQAVRDERKWELVGEGHRRQDLIRWGVYFDTIEKTYIDLDDWSSNARSYFLGWNYTQEGKHELLPIPQREVDLSGYTQNNGWF